MSESHFVEGGELARVVDEATSPDAVAYLQLHRPSCHSDPGADLIRSAESCGDWIAFSPSFKQCLYVALVTKRTIFAVGLGQRSVAYRLPAAERSAALSTGAVEAKDIGPDWVRFELYAVDHPAPDLRFWTLQAYAAARAGSV